jgi:hypothetical protein
MNRAVKISLSLVISTTIIALPKIANAGANASTASAISIEFQPGGNVANFSVSSGGGISLSNATGIRSISTAVASGDTAVASAQTTTAGTSATARGFNNVSTTLDTQALTGVNNLTLAPAGTLVIGSDLGSTMP